MAFSSSYTPYNSAPVSTESMCNMSGSSTAETLSVQALIMVMQQ
jgi:hypothetical protein